MLPNSALASKMGLRKKDPLSYLLLVANVSIGKGFYLCIILLILHILDYLWGKFFRRFFGKNEGKMNCFWDFPTFITTLKFHQLNKNVITIKTKKGTKLNLPQYETESRIIVT